MDTIDFGSELNTQGTSEIQYLVTCTLSCSQTTGECTFECEGGDPEESQH